MMRRLIFVLLSILLGGANNTNDGDPTDICKLNLTERRRQENEAKTKRKTVSSDSEFNPLEYPEYYRCEFLLKSSLKLMKIPIGENRSGPVNVTNGTATSEFFENCKGIEPNICYGLGEADECYAEAINNVTKEFPFPMYDVTLEHAAYDFARRISSDIIQEYEMIQNVTLSEKKGMGHEYIARNEEVPKHIKALVEAGIEARSFVVSSMNKFRKQDYAKKGVFYIDTVSQSETWKNFVETLKSNESNFKWFVETSDGYGCTIVPHLLHAGSKTMLFACVTSNLTCNGWIEVLNGNGTKYPAWNHTIFNNEAFKQLQ